MATRRMKALRPHRAANRAALYPCRVNFSVGILKPPAKTKTVASRRENVFKFCESTLDHPASDLV
jgi:hypothetical protein